MPLSRCSGCHFGRPCQASPRTPGACRAHSAHAAHEQRYKDLWDKTYPDGTACDDFNQYISTMQQQTSWGGYWEITAAARLYNKRIYVMPENEAEEVMVFHDTEKATGNIVLWYNGSHYDWLKPKCEKGTVPTVVLSQRGKPQKPLRGGGKSVKAVFTTSSPRTVFTHSSKSPAKASARKSLNKEEESRAASACVSAVRTTMEEVEAPELQLQQQRKQEQGSRPWREALRKRSIRQLRGEHQSRFATHDTVGWTCPLCAFGLEFRVGENTPKEEREKTLRKVWTGHPQSGSPVAQAGHRVALPRAEMPSRHCQQ